MQPYGLRFGAAATDKVDCGAFGAIGVPAAATWAVWFIPTTQADAGHRLVAKATMQMSYANASNNRVVFEAPRATTFTRALTEAANFPVNWTTRLGAPVFMAGTMDLSAGLPKLYMGDLNTPVSEPSAYVTQTLGSGAGTDTTGNNLTLCGIGSIPTIGTALWAFVSIAELTLAEIMRLKNVMALNVVPRDFRGYVSSWRLGTNGTGLVIDESGRGNHGTITGATLASNMTNLGRLGPGIRPRVFDWYIGPSAPGYLLVAN